MQDNVFYLKKVPITLLSPYTKLAAGNKNFHLQNKMVARPLKFFLVANKLI